MNRLMRACVATIALMSVAGAARGDLVLSFTTTAPDLNNIIVGDSVQVSVVMSGIGEPSDPAELSSLSVDAAFPTPLFGTPTSLTPGPIVPDPTPASFASSSTPGIAGAVYDNIFSGAPSISQNGVFYTFTVTALEAGSGSFVFTSAVAFDDAGTQYAPNTDATLAFTVHPQTVPEPASLLLCGLGAASLAALRGRRRRRDR